MESHERVIAELTEDYESKLAEEALKIESLQQDKTELEREFEEIKRQLEEDADRQGMGAACCLEGGEAPAHCVMTAATAVDGGACSSIQH